MKHSAAIMSEALRECFVELGGIRTKEEVIRWFRRHYPNNWKPGTLRDHLYGGRVNHPLAYAHRPGQKKFIYDHGDHHYEIHDARRHGEFRDGIRIGAAGAPGWILIHSSNPKFYGPGRDYSSPMDELEEEDAVNRTDVRWHWRWPRPPRESGQSRRILLAWKGEIFGQAVATVTHRITVRGFNFAFILRKYVPLDQPMPLSRLRLGPRSSSHRSLIRLDERTLAAFDAANSAKPVMASPDAAAKELLEAAADPNKLAGKGAPGVLPQCRGAKGD